MKKFVSILLTAAILMSFVLMGTGTVAAEEQTYDIQITSTIMVDEIYGDSEGVYPWMTYGKFDAIVNGEELSGITLSELEIHVYNAYGVSMMFSATLSNQYESPWTVGNTYQETIQVVQYNEETQADETVMTLNVNVMVHETLVESVAVQPLVLYEGAAVYKDILVVVTYKDGTLEKTMGGYSKDWEFPTQIGTYNYTINHNIYGELPVSIQHLEIPTAGKCGENLDWAYDADTKKLTISGTGDMYEIAPDLDTFWEYTYTYEPEFWYCDVKDIVVEEGVTGLSNFAFGWLSQETLQLPTTLKAIPDMWLTVSTAMTSLEIPEGITALTGWPFGSPGNSFTAVKELYLPSTIRQLDKLTVMLSGMNNRTGAQTLETVYFAGTQEQWDAVEFVESEETLKEIYGADYEEGTVEFCEAMRERFADLDVSIKVDIPVEDGTASVPDEAVKVTEGKDVVIDVSKETEKVESAVIGATAVEKITEAETSVEIKLSDASVALDAAAVEAITKQADNASMTIVAKKVEETQLNAAQQAALEEENVCMVLNLEAYAGDTKVSSFGSGLAKITVPYTLGAGQNGSGLHVAYVADDGTVSIMPTTYADGKLTFMTPHFSSYAVLETATSTEEAKIGETGYPTLEAAMAAAQENQTIVLQSSVEVDSLVLTDGICLDLNGWELTANYVVAFSGADLVDNAGTGVLKCKKVRLEKDNKMLPLWVELQGGYRLFNVLDYQKYKWQNENGFQHYFKPAVGAFANDFLLAQTDSGVTVKAKLYWQTSSGNDAEQNFVVTAQDVKTVYSDDGMNVSLTVSGVGAFKNVLNIATVLVSDTGVVWQGDPLVYTGTVIQ